MNNIKRHTSFHLILATCCSLAFSPSLAQSQSITSSTDFEESINSLFAFISPGDPGCSLGIIERGKLTYSKSAGLANLDWEIPISTSSIFDVASVSKQFTASAIALLEIDGLLSLDDEVRKWIPEFKDYGAPITIRQLLNHTSGIRDYLSLMNLAGTDFNNVFTEFDAVELIVRQEGLNFPSGDQFLYSNSGYLLAAHIVRRITGKSLRAFLEERVFAPLNMTKTQVWDDSKEIVSKRATGYSLANDDWQIDHLLNFQMGGDGQVLTSIDELVKWDNNFYQPVVGGNSLLQKLHDRGVLNNGDVIDYALGLTVDEYRGLKRVMHTGSWGGFRANITRYPDEHTSFILLCNRFDGTQELRITDVADLVLVDKFTEQNVTGVNLRSDGSPVNQPDQQLTPVSSETPDPQPATLKNYTGEYWSSELGVSFHINLEAEQLKMMRPNGSVTNLEYVKNKQYTGDGLVVYFESSSRMKIDTGRVLGITFIKEGV